MFFKAIKSQTQYIMQKWTFIITWCIICGFVAYNFIHNVNVAGERLYVSEMYDVTKIITLSDWTKAGYFLMIYYPILVVLPTSSIILDDRNSKMQLYLKGRIGQKKYYVSKAVAVFVATFVLFTIPFILELLAGVVCFHLESNGDPSNFPYYQTVGDINNYFCPELYVYNRFLYGFVMIIIFGLISGILALFNFAISTMPIIKYKIFTLLPLYLVLYVLAMLQKISNLKYTTNYMFILRLFNSEHKNYVVYGIVCLIFLVISMSIIVFRTRRDDLG